MNDIIKKVKNNYFKEQVSYNPYQDEKVVVEKPEPKWEIPDIMKTEV